MFLPWHYFLLHRKPGLLVHINLPISSNLILFGEEHKRYGKRYAAASTRLKRPTSRPLRRQIHRQLNSEASPQIAEICKRSVKKYVKNCQAVSSEDGNPFRFMTPERLALKWPSFSEGSAVHPATVPCLVLGTDVFGTSSGLETLDHEARRAVTEP